MWCTDRGTRVDARDRASVAMESKADSLFGDLFFFLCAVLCGTTAGIVSQQIFLFLLAPPAAANVSLAIATTCTGAAHSRLVHRKPFLRLVPHLVAGAPVAYAAMRAIHFVAGL